MHVFYLYLHKWNDSVTVCVIFLSSVLCLQDNYVNHVNQCCCFSVVAYMPHLLQIAICVTLLFVLRGCVFLLVRGIMFPFDTRTLVISLTKLQYILCTAFEVGFTVRFWIHIDFFCLSIAFSSV